MYSNLQDTTEIMVRGSKLCHVQKYGNQDTTFSHHTTFVHVISFLRKRNLTRTGHEGPEGEET
jgi:hypothetical protein